MDSKSRTNGPSSTISVGQAKTCNKYKGQELSNLPTHPSGRLCCGVATETAGHVTRIYMLSWHTHTHIYQPLEQAPYNHSRKNASNLELKYTDGLKFGSVKPQRLSHHYGLNVYLGKNKMSAHNEFMLGQLNPPQHKKFWDNVSFSLTNSRLCITVKGRRKTLGGIQWITKQFLAQFVKKSPAFCWKGRFVRYRHCKSPPLGRKLTHTNPLHILTPYPSNFNIKIPSMSAFPYPLSSLDLRLKQYVHAFTISHMHAVCADHVILHLLMNHTILC
jgi:hypothetical protein